GADPCGEREPVGAIDRGDRVELDGPEPPDLRLDRLGASAAEARRISLRGDDETPDGGEADGCRAHPLYLPATGASRESDSVGSRSWRAGNVRIRGLPRE